jgi:hypothetical protein
MDERIAHGSVSSAPEAPPPGRGRPIRKVLFFGKNMSRSRCTGGLVDALQQHGLDVKWLNMATLRRWLGKDRSQRWADRVFRSYQPDLVFVFCRDLPGVLLEDFRRRADVVLWVEEPLDDLDAGLTEYMSHADLVCLSNPQKRAMLLERGVQHIAFLMSGFSPRFHSPTNARRPERDVVFIGGPGRLGQRAGFLAEVSRHFSTEIFGTSLQWERWVRRYPVLKVSRPIGNARFRHLCASSRIVLGLNQVNEDRLYFSNRTASTWCGTRTPRSAWRRSRATSAPTRSASASPRQGIAKCSISTSTTTASAGSSRSCPPRPRPSGAR